jgi:glyoxylase-like metal-dependent hydrolase (beta-lactamase superfamily II)
VSDFLTQVVHRRVFNAYLVREDDGLTLVDTGPAGALDTVRTAIRALDAPLRRVVLTHAHADHLGDWTRWLRQTNAWRRGTAPWRLRAQNGCVSCGRSGLRAATGRW